MLMICTTTWEGGVYPDLCKVWRRGKVELYYFDYFANYSGLVWIKSGHKMSKNSPLEINSSNTLEVWDMKYFFFEKCLFSFERVIYNAGALICTDSTRERGVPRFVPSTKGEYVNLWRWKPEIFNLRTDLNTDWSLKVYWGYCESFVGGNINKVLAELHIFILMSTMAHQQSNVINYFEKRTL